MAATWDEWVKNIEKLRKNVEKCGLDVLKKDYAKGYKKICEKIGVQTQQICTDVLVGGMRFQEGDCEGMELVGKRVLLILRQEQEAGTFKEISRAVFKEYSTDKALDILSRKVWPRTWFQAYGPYWVSCCREENGNTACGLLPGYVWDGGCGLWRGTTPEGGWSMTVMLPPTMELLEKEYRAWQSEG